MPGRIAPILFVVLPVLLQACAAPRRGPVVAFEPAQYDAAFDAARDALIDHGFALDRVDAQAGVIDTAPRETAGLATPWHPEQSTARDELADFANAHRRIARVTFGPTAPTAEAIDAPAAASPPPSPPAGGGTAFEELRVRVVLERRQSPGRRIEPDSIRRSSAFGDPALGARGMLPVYWTPIDEDEALGERIAARIRSRLRRNENGAPDPGAP